MKPVERFIKKNLDIVHGRKALNKQLPAQYHRKTTDWDLFGRNPKKEAFKLQAYLDKQAGSDRFYDNAVPLTGSKKVVYRVIDRVTGEEVADFMSVPKAKKVYTTIDGIRYERLQRAKLAYKKILADPKYKHRWAKAKFDLHTIEQYEKDLKAGVPIEQAKKRLNSLLINN